MTVKSNALSMLAGAALGLAGGVAATTSIAADVPAPKLVNFQLAEGREVDGGVVWFGTACGDTPREDGSSETTCWEAQVGDGVVEPLKGALKKR